MKEQLAVMETNTTTVIQRGPRLAEWTLRSWGGGRYGLTNDTRNEPLFDVFLRFPEGATCEGVTDWGVFPPGATREFTMTLDPTNPMRLVTVIFKWDPKKSGDDEFSIEVPPEAADRSRTAK